MSAEVSAALVSGGAAFLGAMVAFVGLWSTTRRTVYVTREQRRFDLAREKSGDILPEMYTKLLELFSEYGSYVDQSIELRDEKGNINPQLAAENVEASERQRKELEDRVIELFDYHKRNSIWLPSALANMIDQLLSGLIENAEEYATRSKENLSYAIKRADRAVWRRMQKQKEALGGVEAMVEAIDAQLRDLGIEVDATNPTADEVPEIAEIKAIRAEVKASTARAKDLLIEPEATRLDVDESQEVQAPDSQDVDAAKPTADIFVDTFMRRQGLAKALFRLWLTGARVWDLPEIRKYSRKVLGVDEISVDGAKK